MSADVIISIAHSSQFLYQAEWHAQVVPSDSMEAIRNTFCL